MKKETKKIASELTCRATAALSIEVAKEIENNDKPIEDLLNGDKDDDENQEIRSEFSEDDSKQ